MPMNTMRLTSIVSSIVVTSPDVLPTGDRLKMIRIDTGSDPAKMIELESLRNRADQTLVDKTVGVRGFHGLDGVVEGSYIPL
jgi:hypothetical protein